MSAIALVVGGTGTLGAPVVRRLLEDGREVRVLVRDSAAELSADARAVRGDITDNDSLRKAITGCELVHVNLRGGPREHDFETVEHHGGCSGGSDCCRLRRRAPDLCLAHVGRGRCSGGVFAS